MKCDALLIGVGAEGIDPAIFAYQGGDAGALGLLRDQPPGFSPRPPTL